VFDIAGMERKNLIDVDVEIALLRDLIAAGKTTPQVEIDLADLLQRREALIKLMTSDGPTKDIDQTAAPGQDGRGS
jgi:hypothetical protein